MKQKRKEKILTAAFLAVEGILYCLILTTGGKTLIASSYASIVLCFVYACVHLGKQNWLIPAGLLCTVGADFFLVVCSPIRQLGGMLCFFVAQSLYALWLHRHGGNRGLLILRFAVTGCAVAAVFLVLGERTDALALVSLCYYSNLIVNLIVSFAQFRRRRILSIGFVLFLLCDTVIGLQMANGVYLSLRDGSLLHWVISVDFNLAWFFYLPSQVLIALSSRKSNK